MKKFISLVLAVVLMLSAAPFAAAESGATLFDWAWAMSDWSFLADWGVLTEEEATLLSMDRQTVEAGQELVRTVTVATGALNDDPHMDQLLADFTSRMTIVNRSRANGEALEVLLDGEAWLSFALDAGDGGYVLDSSLAPHAVSFSAGDLTKSGTLMRLTGAMAASGLITRDDAMVLNLILLNGGLPWPMSMLGMDVPAMEGVDLSAWDAGVDGILGRRAYVRIPGGGTNSDARPEGCDPAAQVWTLEVTPEDLRDLAVAALIVIRDNPVLSDQLAVAVDFDSSVNAAGSNVSFNDAVINPLLEDLAGAEPEPFFLCSIRGYEDDTGALVRL